MFRRAAVGWLAGLLVAGASGSAFAQPIPDPPKLPPIVHFPQPPTDPKVPPTPPRPGSPEVPPTPSPVPAGNPAGDPAAGPIPGPAPPIEIDGPPGRPVPLPGSVEDEYTQGLLAREGFRTYTWRDTAITAFPSSLLWDPGLAVQKDPRMKATYSNLPNYRGSRTVDTSIGGTQGLYRFDFIGRDLQVQTDIFGLVQTRLTPEDKVFADYRFGFPLTARWGWWQGKLAYEHTSSHLGDRLLRAIPQAIPSWAKDEVVVSAGRIIEDQLRVYATYAYALQLFVPGVEGTFRTRSRFDLGFEWYDRRPTGFWGTPYLAGNVEWQGSQGFQPNYTAQAGWMWRNPTTRLSQFRVFVEHYRGQSPYGINSTVREQYTAAGIAFDY